MTGIVISYVILLSVLFYIIIRLKGRWVLKAICILAGIYYSIAVAYSLESLKGWPTSNEVPEKSRIIWIQIQEPDWIYFWVQYNFEDKQILNIDPRKAFQYVGKDEPRIHKVPYSKELHKQILEMMKRKKGNPGSQIMVEKGKRVKDGKPGQGIKNARNMRFRILNPFEIMPKN